MIVDPEPVPVRPTAYPEDVSLGPVRCYDPETDEGCTVYTYRQDGGGFGWSPRGPGPLSRSGTRQTGQSTPSATVWAPMAPFTAGQTTRRLP